MYDNKVPTKKRLQIVYLGENSKKKNLYGSIYDKTGALLGHFISAKLGKNDFILLEESKNDYERKIKRHKNNLYNK